jgi:hypothetical protein
MTEEPQAQEEQFEEEEFEGEYDDPQTVNLAQAIGDYLMESEKPWEKRGRIYASELGLALGPEHSGCTLAFWLKCKNEPTKPDTPGRILMRRIGDLVHDYIASIIGRAVGPYGWYVVAIEERVTLEVEIDDDTTETIGSRLDIKLRHYETGLEWVIDIKTKRGGAFRFLKESKPGDVLQVQGYMKGEDADLGSVLYVDREGQNLVRQFDVDRGDERPEEAVRRLVAIRDNETPPPAVGLKVKRVNNKGPDSIYVNLPWQIEWCDLQSCACRKALPCKSVPKGIVAKLHDVKDQEGTYEIRLTEDGEQLRDLILHLLADKYPDESFVLKKKDDA